MRFDYSRLKGLIVQEFDNYSDFAKELEVSPSTVSGLLTNKKSWTQVLILRACNILHIVDKDIKRYFFCVEVEDVK